ncbi:MAG: hypothetical protein BGO77_03250 [Caedibacter sp. 37-49]|nr:MAG: hypothetical protein BGO77_03250 [Caedibacter sp. 37-49]
MKFLRVLTAILWVSQSFSPSWGTLVPLSEEEKKAAPAQHMVAYAPPQEPEHNLLTMLPPEIWNQIASQLKADVTIRIMISHPVLKTFVKKIPKYLILRILNRNLSV